MDVQIEIGDKHLEELPLEVQEAAKLLVEALKNMTPEELARAIIRMKEIEDGNAKFKALVKD